MQKANLRLLVDVLDFVLAVVFRGVVVVVFWRKKRVVFSAVVVRGLRVRERQFPQAEPRRVWIPVALQPPHQQRSSEPAETHYRSETGRRSATEDVISCRGWRAESDASGVGLG